MDLFSGLYPFVFCSLGSGSSGNSYYVGNGSEGFLVDAGLNGRTIRKRLAEVGVLPRQLKGILLTHDHNDHIKGLSAMVNEHRIPFYALAECHEGIKYNHFARYADDDLFNEITPETAIEIAGLKITPFAVSHDGRGAVGYHIQNSHSSLSIVTDTGTITDEALPYLKKSTAIVLESNYDTEMLMSGPYPAFLKNRVDSETGHLSNAQAAAFFREHYHERMSHIYLCHLSQQNNRPDLAIQATKEALQQTKSKINPNLTLIPLPRTKRTALMHL